MKKRRTTCPDCDGELEDVMLIDATDQSMGGGVGHVELCYASPKAVASSMTGTIQAAGKVKSKMCRECGRIILFGDNSPGGLARD